MRRNHPTKSLSSCCECAELMELELYVVFSHCYLHRHHLSCPFGELEELNLWGSLIPIRMKQVAYECVSLFYMWGDTNFKYLKMFVYH
eukprot:c2181_g1_i1 orf=94-357(-)